MPDQRPPLDRSGACTKGSCLDEDAIRADERAKVAAETARLRAALAPLDAIVAAWADNGLDEDRPDWRAREVGAGPDFSEVELFSGRGGKRLLTLADAFAARDALLETFSGTVTLPVEAPYEAEQRPVRIDHPYLFVPPAKALSRWGSPTYGFLDKKDEPPKPRDDFRESWLRMNAALQAFAAATGAPPGSDVVAWLEGFPARTTSRIGRFLGFVGEVG